MSSNKQELQEVLESCIIEKIIRELNEDDSTDSDADDDDEIFILDLLALNESGTQVLKPSTPMVAADINTRVIERSNIIVDTTTRERPNDYDSLLHETNVLQPKENTGFLLHDVNSELDPRYQEDFDQENLMDLEKVKKLRQEKKKRKISDDQPQTIDRWSDDETYKLLIYLEDNFNKYQKGKKSEFYALVSRDIIKSKTAESIKGRLNRLLEKYGKVKQENNQSGSGRVDWKWMDIMNKIFGCRKNVSPSYLSNEKSGYISISDEMDNNQNIKDEKDNRKKE
ncbi:5645_t:CDS:2 [Funneliformis caledonium]|uniref:5645_t:CDS:1 n=1 Tax=Funneliformis caledonium TaxID=1117310 RepID=A0A9N8WF42_9GLOM|nr:5645_t:CDS:2 [Funneliformis caledonium]